MSAKTAFTLRWIWGNLVGWLLACVGVAVIWCGLGEIVSDVTARYLNTGIWASIWTSDISFLMLGLIALAYGGATIGFAQWQMALKGKLRKWLWIATSAVVGISGTIGLLVAFRVVTPIPSFVMVQPGVMSGFDDTFTLSEKWLVAVLILGISFGVGSGLPQWFVLRRYFFHANRWLVTTVSASLLSFLTFALIVFILKGALISEALIFISGPVISAAITGPVLYDLLQNPTHVNSSHVPA